MLNFGDNSDLFNIKGYKLWLSARSFAHFAHRMQATVVAWQVFQITKDPLALGLIGFFEAIPYVAAALWAGHLVDQYKRSWIMGLSLKASLACTVLLIFLPFTGGLHLPLMYMVLAMTGVAMSFETASASAYVQTIVPTDLYPKAIAWHLSMFQLATIMGPLIGGTVIAQLGMGAGYMVVGILTIASLLLTRRLEEAARTGTPPTVLNWEELLAGFRFIKTQPIMIAAMMLDMFGVLFGDAIAILPIFAQMLNTGPIGYGVLRAAPAIGSWALSTYYANRPFFQQTWSLLLKSVAAFGVCMILFALSKYFVLSVLFLALSGVADGMSVIIRSSIYQAYTPDHLRGRVASVNGIFIRLSNELGAFESGVAARLLGTVPSVIVGGVLTLVTAGVMKWKYAALEKTESKTA